MSLFESEDQNDKGQERSASLPLLDDGQLPDPRTGQARRDYHGERPDAIDVFRTWGVIVVGALAGILLVLTALVLLQAPTTTTRSIAAQPQSPAGVAAPTSTAANPKGGALVANDPALPPAPVVGHYPPDFTLQTIDGQTITLSELRGKPVWLNFWATWCPPCRAEMPEMKQKYAQYKDKGLIILGVDFQEDPDPVRKFITDKGYDWTFLLDLDGSLGETYSVGGLPTHLFVGRDGIIKAIQVGGIPANMMQTYLAKIVGE